MYGLGVEGLPRSSKVLGSITSTTPYRKGWKQSLPLSWRGTEAAPSQVDLWTPRAAEISKTVWCGHSEGVNCDRCPAQLNTGETRREVRARLAPWPTVRPPRLAAVFPEPQFPPVAEVPHA